MSEKRTLGVLVVGGSDLVDATLARADGGNQMDKGLRELISERFPDVDVSVHHRPSSGLAELRHQLETDASSILAGRPDIILLSVAGEVTRLGQSAEPVAEAVAAVEDDLLKVIELVKEEIEAHVLVTNVSTIDPADETVTYQGLEIEPFVLRAHRLDLLLIEVSHSVGISIIDVDRLVAELGADGNVEGPARYGREVCERVASEVVRVLTDYGFFDDRPLLLQVGARGAGG
jgi:hypothetical protein